MSSEWIKPMKSAPGRDLPRNMRQHLIVDKEYSRTLSKEKQFPDGTLTEVVIACARANKDKPAIRGPRQSDKSYRQVTYAQLIQHANEIAKAIQAKATQFTDKFVAILLPRDIEFIECALGILLSGSAYLPLYESLPQERMRWYLDDSEADIVITSHKLQHLLAPIYQGQIIFIEDIEPYFLRSAVQASSAKMPSFSYLKSRVTVHNLAYMIYTSGTTGKPKGVEIEHQGVVNMLMHHANVLVDQKDVEKSVLVAALIFDSSIRETWLPLVTGGCLCIADNVFGINEGTMCAGTPSGLTVATFPDNLQTVMVGGERLTDGCVDNINVGHPKKIINAYGPTETTVECLLHYTDTSKPKEISWIGLPIWNCHIYGVPKDAKPDPETGAFPLAKYGEPCELFVGGVGVARGYRNAPEKTNSKFFKNCFGQPGRIYRTGDLVRWTEKGDLEYLGRTDSQVKLRGFRIELEEVERVCSESPGVAAAAVIILQDNRKQEHLVCYITPAEGEAEPQKRDLIDSVLEHAASEMSDYMVPSEIVVMDSLPFTIGGKVDKRSLPEPQWGSTKDPGAGTGGLDGSDDAEKGDIVKPSNPTEELILLEICEMIDQPADTVSVNDNLFTDFGLTSIDAALLRRKLTEKGLEVDGTATILRHGTVRALANHLLGASNELEELLLETVSEMLDVSVENLSVTDNFFTDYGLTSIDAALLRRKLMEAGIEIDGTATILKHGTVKGLVEYLKGKEESSGGKGEKKAKKLTQKDVAVDRPLDSPLPSFFVWLLTGVGFIFAACLTYVTPIALWVIELSLVHRWGACGWKTGDCENPNYWAGFGYNVLLTPIPLTLLFLLELFIVWAVKWIVIGRYKTGVYSLWGWMYLKWWFVHTFMTFTYFFLLQPLRCTGLLKTWYRCLGAKIGRDVVLDSVCIYEPDLIEIEDNVTVQSDAAIMGSVITRPVVEKR